MALKKKISAEIKSNMKGFATYEFHVSKQSRQKYNFDDSFFSISGNVVLQIMQQFVNLLIHLTKNVRMRKKLK